MSSEKFPPTIEHSGYEGFPPNSLIEYFQGQFEDAYEKQFSEEGKHFTDVNGEFVRIVPLETDDQHALIRGRERIILKPPHPNDKKRDYCEVYELNLNYDYESNSNSGPGSNSNMFIIRDFTDGLGGPFWLLDSEGVRNIDQDVSLDFFMLESDKPENSDDDEIVERAQSMLKKYTHYNIVASVD